MPRAAALAPDDFGSPPSLAFSQHVRIKPSVSLPQLHKPNGNLSRTSTNVSRAEALQRQFEHAGFTANPLSRSSRSRPYIKAKGAPTSQAHMASDRVPEDAASGFAGSSVAVHSKFGSEANLLELRLVELATRRKELSLSNKERNVVSRAAAVESLGALRRVADFFADSPSGSFGTTLHCVADALEPCVFSEYLDDDGRAMPYEQAVRSLLKPQVREANARVHTAQDDLAYTTGAMKVLQAEVEQLRAELAEVAPHVASLEASKQALEIELSSTRRQAFELIRENKELSAQESGDVKGHMTLVDEVERLREANAALTRQAGEVSKALEITVPAEEHEELQRAHKTLQWKFDKLTEKADRSEAELEALRAEFAELRADRDEARQELARIDSTVSPRPQWERLQRRATIEAAELAKLVPGGARLVAPAASASTGSVHSPSPPPGEPDHGPTQGGAETLRLGGTSAASASGIVDQLFEAWSALADLQYHQPNDDAHFNLLGDGAHVPCFLRLAPAAAPPSNRVRNLKMPKREVEAICREFWTFYYEERQRAKAAHGRRGSAGIIASMRKRRGSNTTVSLPPGVEAAAPAGLSKIDLMSIGMPVGNAASSSESEVSSRKLPAQGKPAVAFAEVFERFLLERAELQHREKQQKVAELMGGAGASDAALAAVLSSPEEEERQLRCAAVEMAFNVIDGCRRYHHDADLELFLAAISSRVPADAHAAQLVLIDQLRNAFAVADRQMHGGAASGEVRRAMVPGVIRTIFPQHSDAQVASLMSALEKDAPGGASHPDGTLEYAPLFLEDKDFNQSAFVERARAQALRAPRDYVEEIGAAMRELDTTGAGAVRWRDAAAAIRAVDPTIPEDALDALMSAGLGGADQRAASGGTEEEPEETNGVDEASGTVDIRAFCRRLLYVQPTRSGPPPKPTAKSVDASIAGRRGARRGSNRGLGQGQGSRVPSHDSVPRSRMASNDTDHSLASAADEPKRNRSNLA